MEDKPEIVDLKRNMVALKSQVLIDIAATLDCDVSEIDTAGLNVFRITEGARYPIGELKLALDMDESFLGNTLTVTMQYQPLTAPNR